MFDQELVERNELAKQGLVILLHSGLFDVQQNRLKESLSAGDADAPEEDLLKQIRSFRQQFNNIESLRQLAQSFQSGEE